MAPYGRATSPGRSATIDIVKCATTRHAQDRPAMIGGRRPLTGRKAGDKRIRVERPHAPYFRYAGPGQLVAREAASVPRTPRRSRARACPGRRVRPASRKRGRDRGAPRQEEGAGDLQLGRDLLVGLRDRGDPPGPRHRWRGGDAAVDRGLDRHRASCSPSSPCPIDRCAAPIRTAAGAYVVARTNLAPIFGLIAAASLLIDYVMTVAVSTASAIAQIQSIIPAAFDYPDPDRVRRRSG